MKAARDKLAAAAAADPYIRRPSTPPSREMQQAMLAGRAAHEPSGGSCPRCRPNLRRDWVEHWDRKAALTAAKAPGMSTAPASRSPSAASASGARPGEAGRHRRRSRGMELIPDCARPNHFHRALPLARLHRRAFHCLPQRDLAADGGQKLLH